MGHALVGLGVLFAIVAIWSALGRYAFGRVIQVVIAALAYCAWLSLIPLSFYFIGEDIAEATGDGSYGTAIFIVVVTLCFIPFFLLSLIPWNHFCQYVWRKVGLKLPQSSRVVGEREYYDSERER